MRPALAVGLLALAGWMLAETAAVAAERVQVLEGRIIRALAVHPEDDMRLLVGLKGPKPGDGRVLESRDGGQSWAPLNGGKALSPEASDVQSLTFGSGDAIFAGTWKQGLYLSSDDGASFSRLEGFPSVDIRALRIFPSRPDRLYAATGNAGVVRSTDGGKSWTLLGPETAYVWSLALSRPSNAVLYAASPAKGVYGSLDDGASWYRLFEDEGAYAVDASDYGTDSFIVAGDSGLHISLGGRQWLRQPQVRKEKLSSILGVQGQPMLVGSWSDGVLVIGRDGELSQRLLPGTPVVHLERAGETLLVGTWGQGLYLFPDWFAKE